MMGSPVTLALVALLLPAAAFVIIAVLLLVGLLAASYFARPEE